MYMIHPRVSAACTSARVSPVEKRTRAQPEMCSAGNLSQLLAGTGWVEEYTEFIANTCADAAAHSLKTTMTH